MYKYVDTDPLLSFSKSQRFNLTKNSTFNLARSSPAIENSLSISKQLSNLHHEAFTPVGYIYRLGIFRTPSCETDR